VKHYREYQPRAGTIKLYADFKEKWQQAGLKLGRDQLYAILAGEHLLIRRRKRLKPRTTFSDHHHAKSPDLTRDFEPQEPHELYVSDITYLPLSSGKFCYLYLMSDAYSHTIVGHKLVDNLKAENALEVLNMAEKQRDKSKETIHHSDRGFHYCLPKYKRKLLQMGYQPSNTQSSDPRDNSVAERLNGILKEELIYPFGVLKDLHQAQKRVQQAIQTYNNKRLHLSCDLKPPLLIHQGKHLAVNRWKKKSVNQKTALNYNVNQQQF